MSTAQRLVIRTSGCVLISVVCRKLKMENAVSVLRTTAFFLLVMLLTDCASEQSAIQPQEADSPEVVMDLTGTSWQLIEIRSMNDFVYTPLTVERYTLDFLPAGQLLIRADCNRGHGSWEQRGSLLAIGELAMTRAMCRPESIDLRFLNDIVYVRSFVIRDDRLFMATMADGAILEFEQRPGRYSLGD